jgi:DNA modification methylase
MTDQQPCAPWRNRITGSGTLKVAEAVANPLNFRVHPAHQSAALAASLDEVGWVQQVVVNTTTGNLIDGHLRLELARGRGERELPCLFVELSEEEERLVLASLDPIGAMASADQTRLAELLASVQSQDEQVRGLLEQIARQERVELPTTGGLVDPDEVPEPPAEPVSRPGDLWRCGPHAVLCDDSTKAAGVARLMAGERAIVVASDSPYIVGYTGGAHPQSWSNKAAARDRDWSADYREAEVGSAAEFFRSFLAAAVAEAAAEDAAWYLWHASARQPELAAAMGACRLLVHQQIIWVKSRAVLTHSHYLWAHEPCLYGWRAGHPPARRPPAEARSVWEVPSAIEDGGGGQHPTTKPIELWRRPILYHSAPGEIVFDGFLGSGTCVIAAELTGRRCRALEISPQFVDVAILRWQRVTGGEATLEGDGRTFAEVAAERRPSEASGSDHE